MRPYLSSADTVILYCVFFLGFSFRLGVTEITRVPSAVGCETLMPLAGMNLVLEAAAEILMSFCAVSASRIVSLNENLPLLVLILAVTRSVGAPVIVGGVAWNLTALRPTLPPNLCGCAGP